MKYTTLHTTTDNTGVRTTCVDECFLSYFAMTSHHTPHHPNLKTNFELKVKCTKQPPHSLITYILILFLLAT